MDKKEFLEILYYYKKKSDGQWLSIDDLISIVLFELETPKQKRYKKYNYNSVNKKLLDV